MENIGAAEILIILIAFVVVLAINYFIIRAAVRLRRQLRIMKRQLEKEGLNNAEMVTGK
jgi:hypothetical protein